MTSLQSKLPILYIHAVNEAIQYSQVPNKQGGPNNQGGWKNFRNLINGGSEF